MTTKAIIYCRVSSEKQVNEGHGLDGQELRCKQYAEVRGYDVVKVFKDEGVSGGIVDRPGMKQLLGFLELEAISGQKIVVLIDDISRFARDVEAHFQLKILLWGNYLKQSWQGLPSIIVMRTR
jgi:DNA invertase Pin-like site-specific DNA recombinase